MGEEEGASRAGHAAGCSWVVDPLDGTVNFLFGIPQWSVSVAVRDGAGTIAGAVYDPNRDELFSATRGGDGALVRPAAATSSWRGDGRARRTGAAPAATAAERRAGGREAGERDGRDGAGLRRRRARARRRSVLARLAPRVRDIRRFGSAALDLAWTAAGRFDAYYERSVKQWDIAAGALICERAGLQRARAARARAPAVGHPRRAAGAVRAAAGARRGRSRRLSDRAVGEQADKARRFLQLHRGDAPLLLANAWDAGSASLLASLGFDALATTSSGFAATLGQLDGVVTRDRRSPTRRRSSRRASCRCRPTWRTALPTTRPASRETIGLALAAGLAGCSVEDYSGDDDAPIYELRGAAERVAAAAEVAHAGPVHLVLTARAENHLHGRDDLDDTIERLRAYEQAGADVLYAPGLTDLEDIRRVVESVGLPVNVLARPGAPPVPSSRGGRRAHLGRRGVRLRGARPLVVAAAELREQGTYGFWEQAKVGAQAARSAFAAPPAGQRPAPPR